MAQMILDLENLSGGGISTLTKLFSTTASASPWVASQDYDYIIVRASRSSTPQANYNGTAITWDDTTVQSGSVYISMKLLTNVKSGDTVTLVGAIQIDVFSLS